MSAFFPLRGGWIATPYEGKASTDLQGKEFVLDCEQLESICLNGIEYLCIGDMLFDALEVRAAEELSIRLWPDGKVFYTFEEEIQRADRKIWRAAANEWSKGTCIAFKELRGPQVSQHLNVVTVAYSNSGGISNVSTLGAGGYSTMWIGTSNWDSETISHEIGHVLGLIHEHQRSDRGKYLIPYCKKFRNIAQCEIVPNSINASAYDFESIMHYSRNQDSKDGSDTLVPKSAADKKKWHYSMGTLGYISHLDREAVNYMYCRHLMKP